MFKRFPLLSRALVFLLLPIVAVIIYVNIQLTRSLPAYRGDLTVPGLEADVRIQFSTTGIPSVTANSDHDLFFTQGYLHASERLWQMELQRHLVAGRLSEIFGLPTVSSDIWMRTLRLEHAAQQALNNLSEPALAALQAYSDGINARIAEQKLPMEFALFGLQPQPWQPVHSLMWHKALALDLGLNMFAEINRMQALQFITPAQLQTFYVYDPIEALNPAEYASAEAPKPAPSNGSVDDLRMPGWYQVQQMQRQWKLGEAYAGSNGWVISGEHTQSGAPVLANDPHLSIQQPSLWYAMQLQSPQLHVSGMSFVGLPGIILGRNQHISWGVTNLMSDQQDLFVLDIPLGVQDAYLTQDGLQPIHTQSEYIKVKPDFPELINKNIQPIEIQVRHTQLGPIVTDAIAGTNKVMALRWAALDDDDTSFETFYRLQYARNWQQFRAAVKRLKAPGLHFLYADTQGNIARQVAGSIPIRGRGMGILPQSANANAHLWQGYVPFEQLPHLLNPKSGFVVTANNKVTNNKDADEIVISHEWASDNRMLRITELFNAARNTGDKLDVALMQQWQLDDVDIGVRQLLPHFSASQLQTAILKHPHKLQHLATDALASLHNWQGSYATDSVAAAVFFYWRQALIEHIFEDNLDPNWGVYYQQGISNNLIGLIEEQQLAAILNAPENAWCHPNTPSSPLALTCQQELISSFYQALERLANEADSDDVSDWQWGQLHRIEYAHQPLGNIKLLDLFLKTTYPSPGSVNSINAGNAIVDEEGGFIQTLGPAFRQIFDMSAHNESRFALHQGQSGHINSPFYANLGASFLQGEYQEFTTSDTQVLHLSPQPQQLVSNNLEKPATDRPTTKESSQ